MAKVMLEVIDGLSRAEQRAIYDRLHHQFNSASKAYEASPLETDVWDAVCQATNTSPNSSLGAFVKLYGVKAWRDDCKAVSDYVRASCREAPRRPVAAALMRVSIGRLARYLQAHGRPLSPKRLLGELHMLAFAVDLAFPGYAQAGLLARVAPYASLEH